MVPKCFSILTKNYCRVSIIGITKKGLINNEISEGSQIIHKIVNTGGSDCGVQSFCWT